MADDINPALRAELVAALDVLTPELRGLHDLTNVSISPELASSVWLQIVIRERRSNLIQLMINAMDNALVTLTKLDKSTSALVMLPGAKVDDASWKAIANAPIAVVMSRDSARLSASRLRSAK